MSAGVCHKVQLTCSTFSEVLGESLWGGVLPYMTAHISLVYDLWPCPLSSLVACDCTAALSAAPRPPSPCLSFPVSLSLSLSLSFSVRRALLLIEGLELPLLVPAAPCSALMTLEVCAWAHACTYVYAWVWLCFRPCEGSQSYDPVEDSHLQLCSKRWESRCLLPKCHTIEIASTDPQWLSQFWQVGRQKVTNCMTSFPDFYYSPVQWYVSKCKWKNKKNAFRSAPKNTC